MPSGDTATELSRRKLLYSGGLAITSTALTAGCLGDDDDGDGDTPTPGEVDQELHVTQPIEPRHNYDPVVADDSYSEAIGNHLYDGLYAFGEGFNLEPQLAVGDPEIENDGQRYIIEVVDDANFHNDDPVTAEDVLHSLIAPVHEGTTPAIFFNMIDLEASTTIDEHTVQFDLNRPYAPFQSISLTQNIVNKDARLESMGFDSEDEWWDHDFESDPRWEDSSFNKENPVGSGPFRFVEYVDGDYTDIERWDDYWDDPVPELESVRWVATEDDASRTAQIRAGDTDLVSETAPPDWEVIQDDSSVDLHEEPSVGYIYLGYNCNEGPTAEVDVRRGIEHAFSVSSFVEDTIGQAAENAVAPLASPVLEEWGLPTDDFAALENEFDPQAAADLIGPHVPDPWEPTLIAPPDDTREALIERVGSRLSALDEYGVNIEPDTRRLDSATFSETSSTGDADDYQVYVGGWTGGPDPDYNIYYLLHEDTEGFVQGHYYQPDTDFHDKIIQAQTTLDTDERVDLYEQIITEALEQTVHTPGYTRYNSSAVRPGVEDVNVHPSGRLHPRLVSSQNNTYVTE